MKITNVSRHLTAIEKKAIKAMLEKNILHAKVGRKVYELTTEDGQYYKVSITETVSDWTHSYKQTSSQTFKLIK